MRDATDAEIWRHASQTGAIVVTKDADFAARRLRADGPQILWLRLGNTTNSAIHSRLDEAWSEILPWLDAGEPIVEV